MIWLYHIRLDCEIKPVIEILEYIYDLSYCKVITTKQSLFREIENLKFIKKIPVLNLILNNYYLVAFWYNRHLYYKVTLKIIVFYTKSDICCNPPLGFELNFLRKEVNFLYFYKDDKRKESIRTPPYCCKPHRKHLSHSSMSRTERLNKFCVTLMFYL